MPTTFTKLLIAALFLSIAGCSDAEQDCRSGSMCGSQSEQPDAAPDLCTGVYCGSGSCDSSTGECICDLPHYGERCEGIIDPACIFVGTCSGHGRCLQGASETQYTCECEEGWTGMDCSQPVSPDLCAGSDVGLGCGAGSCDPATGECICDLPYYGDHCQGVIDPACSFAGACGEHGICRQGASETQYTCECEEGWTGTSCEREVFEPIAPAPSSLSAGALGAGHACVIRAGALYCWGDNASGQLGLGDLVARQAPTLVAGMEADVTAIAAGAAHTCAIKAGAVYCWGEGADGQSGGSMAPMVVAGMEAGVTALAVGDAHTCAILAGEVWCWGRNDVGQLGDGTTMASAAPHKVTGLGGAQTWIASGAAHVCSDDGCWGDNAAGQLGATITQPFVVAAVFGDADHLGGARSCLLSDQSFVCVNGGVPSATKVVAAALGAQHVCLIAANTVMCWGDNARGQLGVEQRASSDVFVEVVAQVPSLLFAGFDSTCAAFGEELRCWGDNAKGQLGISGAPSIVATPTAVVFP
jgi:hypothetical protein